MKVVIVVPVYNEKNNIAQLINAIKHYSECSLHQIKVVFVDDNSPDDTADIIQVMATDDNSIHLIRRAGKMGLGSAYRDAFRWILDNLPADVIVQMDADLSHPPELIDKMVSAIRNGADVVVASRYVQQGGVEDWALHRKILSRGANLLAKVVLGLQISDVTSGYRALKSSVVKALLYNQLNSEGYEYQLESIYIISRMRKVIEEVPFLFRNRKQGKSKLTLTELLKFASLILALRFRPVRIEENTEIAMAARV